MKGRKGISPEIKVGLFVLMGLILLAYMSIKVTKGFGIRRGYEVSAIFDSVSGLVKDASVEIAGVEVGRVKDISLKEGKAKVDMIVNPAIRLKKDSYALIRTKGVLGDKFVEIHPGTVAEEIGPGGVIANTTSQTELDRLLTDVGPILRDLKSVTHTLSMVIGTEEGKKTFQELVENFREASASMKSIAQQMEEGKGTLGKLVNDETLYNEVKNVFDQTKETMSTIRKLVKDIEAGKGTVGKLVNDDTLYVEAKEAITNIRKISEKIDKGEGTLGKLVKDDKLYEEVRDAIKSVKKTTEGVQEQTPITTLGVIGAAAIQ
ncbi:MAG TPA: MCE family protein [Syntrophaceae bacterium]|nr:MCE family protein [Syntrophaceae bacterium]